MLKKYLGYTLIEMLMVVVVVGIGTSLAVPSFQGMLARNRLATQTNDMLIAINLARSEASRIGGIVSVQAASPVTNDEFGAGYCVVLGNPGNCNDPVVRRFPALIGDSLLVAIDDDANAGDWPSPMTSIQFNSLGALSGTNNQVRNIDVCLDGYLGRRIRIALIGRPKSWREAEAGDPSPPSIQPSC